LLQIIVYQPTEGGVAANKAIVNTRLRPGSVLPPGESLEAGALVNMPYLCIPQREWFKDAYWQMNDVSTH